MDHEDLIVLESMIACEKYLKDTKTDTSNLKIIKSKINDGFKYSLQTEEGENVSHISFFDYKMKNFDWVLIANLETKSKYRGKGLATTLLKEVESTVRKNGKGLYLFVKPDNKNAIGLYKKHGFKTVKTYKKSDGEFLIMCKGNADINQILKMKFS